jgi:hypothetical protein
MLIVDALAAASKNLYATESAGVGETPHDMGLS